MGLQPRLVLDSRVACTDNERFALLLAEKGADIMQINEFMTTVKGQSRNWVGGSVMTKYGGAPLVQVVFRFPFVRLRVLSSVQLSRVC
jgi:hypothetical protein